MSKVTWLHLSDLHFRATEQYEWDANIVLQGLLNDIQECIDEYELTLDLLLVSGDIAFSGITSQYNQAHVFFVDLLAAVGLPKERVFIVPGNHDVDRDAISQGARAIASSLDSRQKVEGALIDKLDRRLLLRKLDDYARFVNGYLPHTPFDDENYFYAHNVELSGLQVAVLGMNSVWLAYGGEEDRVHLALGERQVRPGLQNSRDSELCIALMHHPFEWLHDFDRESCEALLMDGCDFILNGHTHRTGLLLQKTPDARAMIITAGACYESRQHANRYNFVQLDLEALLGTAILRVWSDQGGGFWTKDVQTYRNVNDGKYVFALGGHLSTTPQSQDPIQIIKALFSRHTERALRLVHLLIPGISVSLPREEVARIEEQLRGGKAVILTGDAGTGKSGIGHQLARSAEQKGRLVLFLDARQVEHIQSETQLQNMLDLNDSLLSTIEEAGRYRGCRFIIDQLDNVVGSDSATLLTNVALDASKLSGVEVVAISRKRESHEVRLLERFTNEGFVELTSYPLSKQRAQETLEQLGISNPTDDLIEIGRNLMNLELIGRINQERPELVLSALTDEVNLWEQYRQVLEQETEQIVAEAVLLAKKGLKSEDRTFCLDYPFPQSHRRLISWGVILCENGRVHRFRHDKLQDFLYAWDATQRHAMPAGIYQDLDAHRARGVLVWMERIYSRQNAQLHSEFLKDVLK